MLFAVGRGHEHADVASEGLLRFPAEQSFGGLAEVADQPVFVDHHHRVGDGFEDRAEMGLPPREIAVDPVGVAARALEPLPADRHRRRDQDKGACAHVIAKIEVARHGIAHQTGTGADQRCEHAGNEAGQRSGDDDRGHEKDECRTLFEQGVEREPDRDAGGDGDQRQRNRPGRVLGIGNGQRRDEGPSVHIAGHRH